jgi:hypothetical protein
MTHQIFEVSTLYGTATLAAALDAGMFDGDSDELPARRILLVSNNAPVPETAEPISRSPGFAGLASRFDEVIDWNAAISPYHPSDWAPSAADAPLWERLFRQAWQLGEGELELIMESVHVPPARALSTLFADAEIQVYADGLMSYGPTRERLPLPVTGRIRRLLHLDLVPGLVPLLLSEHGIPAEPVPEAAFRRVLGRLASASAATPELGAAVLAAPTAVILGQYLAALGILEPEEEEQLHIRMLHGAVAAGHTTVLFKPHPTAPARYSRALESAAAEAGTRLIVLGGTAPAEAVYELCRPGLVVGCFSTALLTAASLYRIPVSRTGTELVLERLTPYQNSNRIPAVIADALLPESPGAALLPSDAAARTAPLLRTIGFCMQARSLTHLRGEATAWLHANYGPTTAHYFRRRRLTALELPGGFGPVRAQRLRRNPAVRRAVRAVRAVRA